MNRASSHPGFSLIELLVAMALIGVLMSSLGMVMGQVVQNNDILTEHLTVSNDMVTLRRILHRDLQDMSGSFEMHKDGFEFKTSHNMLLDSPLPMRTRWRIKDGQVQRIEMHNDLCYNSTRVFMDKLTSWNLELYDHEMDNWYDLLNLQLAQRKVDIGAMRITVVDEKGQETQMVERLPYAEERD